MRAQTRVILWGREDVISRGVEILLSAQNNLTISRITGEDNYAALIREIENVEADVIIINPGACLQDPHLPLQLMKDYPGIKVITLNLESSSFEVYNKKRVWMNEISDLFDFVRSKGEDD